VTDDARRNVRRCIKCGREVGPDQSMCDICNRAGMVTPSATQYHGTIVVAIVAGIVAMAIAAGLATRGVGPFEAQVVDVAPAAAEEVEVVVRVVNTGTQDGTATCRVSAVDAGGRPLRTRTVLIRVEAGAAAEITALLTGVPRQPADVTVACS